MGQTWQSSEGGSHMPLPQLGQETCCELRITSSSNSVPQSPHLYS